jgi:Mlc titration factor MtfA (ptsG expression regulator)
VLGFLKKRRRREYGARPFPHAWEEILHRGWKLYSRLPEQDRYELHRHVHVFLAEKRFEGCDGQEITDEVRLVVAAQACLLLLHRETDYFPEMKTVMVYPTLFYVDDAGTDESGWVVTEFSEDRSGESWDRGPVILAWEDVAKAATGQTRRYNVVVHEFAHQIDLESGEVDGVPRLDSKERYHEWDEVFTAAYDKHCREVDRGLRTAIDDYGAEGPSEFFAVAVETFFEDPDLLQRKYPGVYDALRGYFRQDPVSWPPANAV